MNRFEYAAPVSLNAGLQALRAQRVGAARWLAGGTDLLPLMKARIAEPPLLVSLKRVAELRSDIACDREGIELGALVTLADIERHDEIGRVWPALAQAAASAATPQLRNMATLGGTLMQRPRCWYFRDREFHCWLKGGLECTARSGENGLHAVFETGPCRAVHPSDVACALSALDAQVEVRGRGGARRLPLDAFFAPPVASRRTETTLAADDVVMAVRIPRPANAARSVYLKAMDRAVWSFALVSVAAAALAREGRVESLRVTLGGVAAVPWRVDRAMQPLLATRPDAAAIARAAADALADAEPLRMNAYKLPLAEALIRRALQQVLA